MTTDWELPESVKQAMCVAYDVAMHNGLIAVAQDGDTGKPLDLDEHAEIVGLQAAAPLAIASYLRYLMVEADDIAVQAWLRQYVRDLDPEGITK